MNEKAGSEQTSPISHAPTFVSVVVPVFNGGEAFDRCLAAVKQSDWPNFECIVVDDASSDPQTAEIARRHGVQLEQMKRRAGPAMARNAGVMKARGEVIFFTDADVLLHRDALGKAATALKSDPGLTAVFGSYDDRPGHGSVLSRYRNLYHHWNHQIGNERASTFWTGCGAIRKDAFLELGGFSPEYARPSIEDIELGYRLREAGHEIRLLKSMLCTHLKQWKFRDMLRTDIFQRGVPWTALRWRHRTAPADLNLNWRAKIATVSAALLPITLILCLLSGHARAVVPTLALLLGAWLCGGLTIYPDAVNPEEPKEAAGKPESTRVWKSLLALLVGVIMPLLILAWAADPWALIPLLLIAVIVWAQKDFYRLLSTQGGIGFAIAVVPLQIVFFMSCALSVPLGFLVFLRRG